MNVISIDFENEVTPMDREKFKKHVVAVTRKELEEDISHTMELLETLMNIVQTCDIDSKATRMAFADTYKKLRKSTNDLPHSVLRHKHMMKLIDTF